MYCIKVYDQNYRLVEVTDREHNRKNIHQLAETKQDIYGKILRTDSSSDCITIVTYEMGVLGFSI